jgi:hypothetical protein
MNKKIITAPSLGRGGLGAIFPILSAKILKKNMIMMKI